MSSSRRGGKRPRTMSDAIQLPTSGSNEGSPSQTTEPCRRARLGEIARPSSSLSATSTPLSSPPAATSTQTSSSTHSTGIYAG